MNPRILSLKVMLLALILLVLDICVLPHLRVGPAQLSLGYLLILYAAFRWHWSKSIPMAILVGVLYDFASSMPLGVVTMSLVLACFALNIAVQKIERYFVLMRLLTTFLFILGVSLIQMVFASALGMKMPGFWYSMLLAISHAGMATVVMPLFFAATTRWFQDRAYLRQYELFT